MENKLTKVIIGGKEYIVTDKQAQQMLEVISGKMEELENEIKEVYNPANWWRELK